MKCNKKVLTALEIEKIGTLVGTMCKGKTYALEDYDLKDDGFYILTKPKSEGGEAVYRFFVAVNTRTKRGATRTLNGIKKGRSKPARDLQEFNMLHLYHVPHYNIVQLIAGGASLGALTGRVNIALSEGQNYNEYNLALGDLFKFSVNRNN